jgi:hypothetical protein
VSDPEGRGANQGPGRNAAPTRRDGILHALGLVLAAGVPLAAYLRTLAPGVLTGDSAEFQYVSRSLGFAHAGFPLLVLLGKAFTILVPFEDVARRVNFLSAVSAAAACAVLFEIVRGLTGRPLAALIAALALGFSFTFWSQAIMAEAYALHGLFFLSTFGLLVAWYRTGLRRYLVIGALLYGLGFGNHVAMVLLAPAYALFVLIVDRRRRVPFSRTCLVPLFVAAGFLPNLIALLAFHHMEIPDDFLHAVVLRSPDTWGLPAGEPRSFPDRLLFMYTGRQLRAYLGSRSAHGILVQLEAIPLRLLAQFWPLGVLAALAGWARAWRRFRAVFWLAAGVVVVQSIFNAHYSIWEIEAYYIPVYALCALMIGLAAAWLEEAGESRSRWAAPAILAALAAANLILVEPTARALRGIAPGQPENVRRGLDFAGTTPDLSRALDAGRRGREILASLPPGAIVFTGWDDTYLLKYLARFEAGRRDVLVEEAYPSGDSRAFSERKLALIESARSSRPIYFTVDPWDLKGRYRFEFAPGHLLRLAGSGEGGTGAR